MIKKSDLENTLITSNGKQLSVSTTVRMYWRKIYAQQLGKYRNADLNEVIASDYAKSPVVHRFLLKSGNVGEIRKSSRFYYVGAVEDSGINIIVVQAAIKNVPKEISQQRQNPNWQPAKKK